MKKVLQIILNVLWVIFCGLEIAITEAIVGALCCITIIGIPLGLQHFKFIKLGFAPFGKTIASKYSRHPVMNTLYGIFGGWETGIIYYVIGLILCITIIFAPLGVQLIKFGSFNFCPFGAEIVSEGEYSSSRETNYDVNLFKYRVNSNPDKLIRVNGEEITVRNYVRGVLDSEQEAAVKWRKYHKIMELFGRSEDKKKQDLYYKLFIIFLSVTVLIPVFILFIENQFGTGGIIFQILIEKRVLMYYLITIAVAISVTSLVVSIVMNHKVNACHSILFKNLYDAFDTKKPMKTTFGRMENVFKYIPKRKVKEVNNNSDIPEIKTNKVDEKIEEDKDLPEIKQ